MVKTVTGPISFLAFPSQEACLLYLTRAPRFYFVDERKPDGRPVGLQIDGDAHADMFWTLAHEPKQSKWLVTFTKDGGRQAFAGVDFNGNTRHSYDDQFGR